MFSCVQGLDNFFKLPWSKLKGNYNIFKLLLLVTNNQAQMKTAMCDNKNILNGKISVKKFF